MNSVSFFVPGVPKAQPRHRARVMGNRAVMYLPSSSPVKAWKKLVAAAARKHYRRSLPLWEGPVGVTMKFVLPRPKQIQWKRKQGPELWSIGTPDQDNLEKAVYDALTGIAWADDAQVCRCVFWKVIGSTSDEPGLSITIQQLDGDAWPIRLPPSK